MTLEQIGLCIFGVFILIAIVATISSGEAKKPKSNIRLPRTPSWDRAAKYYGDTQ